MRVILLGMSGSEQRATAERSGGRIGGIDCVFLTCFHSEFSFLALVLKYSGIRLHRADTLEEADFLLAVTGATAFLTDVAFLDGSWCDALRMLSSSHPLVPPMVVADPADTPFLSDIYTYGACGVLWKPFDTTCLIEVIRTAHQAARDRALLLSEADFCYPHLPASASATLR